MQPILKVHKPAKPILAISLLVGSVYSFLTLITYSATDPSWNHSSTKITEISNLGGYFGSYFSDGFLQLFGITSYLFVIVSFFIGYQLFRGHTISLTDKSQRTKRPKWHRPAGYGMMLVFSGGLVSLLPYHIYGSIPLGGFLGSLIASFGKFCFSSVGSVLLYTGGLWASLVLVTEKTWFFKSSPEKFKAFLFYILSMIKLPFDYLKEKFPEFKKKPKIGAAQTSKQFTKSLSELFKSRTDETKSHLVAEEESEFAEEEDFEEAEEFAEDGPGYDEPDIEDPKEDKFFSLFNKSKKPVGQSDRVVLMDRASLGYSANYNENFELPSLQLLDLPEGNEVEISKDELIVSSKALEQKLLDFGIKGEVKNILPGPIITRYEYEPAPGVKVKNIINLTDDLKLAMKAISIRIIAPIPGQAAVGIEIPNPRRQTVYLREILQNPLFQNSRSPLTLGMGKTTSGLPYVADLAKMPHLLIAGATGSGKSVGLNAMVVSMLYKASPDELKMIMIDPKMLELSVYEGIPHLLLPVLTDPKKASRALMWAVKEMERRYKLISSLGARNLDSYNHKVQKLTEDELKNEMERVALEEEKTSSIIDEYDNVDEKQEAALKEAGLKHYVKLPKIVIIIDELADLIMVAARDIEESIARLAQMARAAGIHLIVATQRPSVDVITGVIKANLPTRCAFQVASKVDSRTIIDIGGADNLIGDGDMLFMPPGTSRLERLHGPFVSEDEIAQIVRHLKSQGQADYRSDINLEESQKLSSEQMDDIDDELYQKALDVIFETQSASASMIQRRLRIGYNRAARLIERMEKEGIVSSPMGGGKGREILVTPST